MAGDQATRKKVATHPIIRSMVLEGVRNRLMHKDVHEKLSSRLEPAVNSGKQFWPIAHVFKHFHGDHAVKLSGCNIKGVHVTRDHLDIGKLTVPHLGLDVFALRLRIGDSGNVAVRIVLSHPEGE